MIYTQKSPLFRAILAVYILMGIQYAANAQSALLQKVPLGDRQAFLESLVYEENLFRGAEVAYLEPHLTKEEIGQVIQELIQADAGGVEAIRRIYEGYKPKPRGCVVNKRWICVIEADR